MRVEVIVILLAASSGSIACDVALRKTSTSELSRELECDGRLVAFERVMLRASKSLTAGLCEYSLSKQAEGLSGCRAELDPYCGMSKQSELRTFAFSEKCDWSDPDRTFQLGDGVSTSELPQMIGAFNAAKKLVISPQGTGWTSPMQVLSKAELSDVTGIDKEGEKWRVYLHLCTGDLNNRGCSAVAVSFGPSPASLEDVRASWVD